MGLRTAMKNFRKPTESGKRQLSNANDHPCDSAHHSSDTVSGSNMGKFQPSSKKRKVMICMDDEDETIEQTISVEEYEEQVEKLKIEFKRKKGKNLATIKKIMKDTRQLRWKWICNEKPSVKEVLIKFPALATERAVSGKIILI